MSEEGEHGRAAWTVDRPDDDDALGTLWLRWTDGGTDMHLHRVCEIVPQISFERTFPFVSITEETGEPPTFPRTRATETGYEQTGETIQFRFVSGVPRLLLRHVPLVVLTALVILVVGAEFTPGVDGVSTLVPEIQGPDAGLFVLYLAITPILLWLLSTVDVVEYREFPKAAMVYGLIVALASGVAVSLFFVLTASHPSETPPNVVFVSGYLLLLLVAGQFLYEATLRIEHLFVKLPERTDDVVGEKEAYYRFLTDLHDSLDASVLGLSPSRLFGVLFASQFVIIWVIGNGPQTLDYALGIGVNAVFNAVLATVTFQFLVVVRYFNHLLNAHEKYADVDLSYEPFHVDGHGGFRDLGRFATRINIILSMAGLYLVYRLYVVGGRSLPRDGLMAFGDPLGLAVWLLSFVGPVVAYALGVSAWGYYSFWSMHTKMVRSKHQLARQYQGTSHSNDLDHTPGAGDRIDTFQGTGGPAWAALQGAPTWPLDVNKMLSLVSGNALPLLFPVTNLLF